MSASLRYRDQFTPAEKMAYNCTLTELRKSQFDNISKKNTQDAQRSIEERVGGGYERYTKFDKSQKEHGVNTTTLDTRVALMSMWMKADLWGKMVKEAMYKEYPSLFLPVVREPIKQWAKGKLAKPIDYVLNTEINIPDLVHSASIVNGRLEVDVSCKDPSKNQDHEQMLDRLRDLYKADLSEWLTAKGYFVNKAHQVLLISTQPTPTPMTPEAFAKLRDDPQPGTTQLGPDSFAAYVSQKWGRFSLEQKNEKVAAAAPPPLPSLLNRAGPG
jgi:hypothetical protein